MNSFELDALASAASNAWIEDVRFERKDSRTGRRGEEGAVVEGVATTTQLCQGVGTLPMKRTSSRYGCPSEVYQQPGETAS